MNNRDAIEDLLSKYYKKIETVSGFYLRNQIDSKKNR